MVAPGEPGYNDARQILNAMIDSRPALIARCATAADVIACIGSAQAHGLVVGARRPPQRVRQGRRRWRADDRPLPRRCWAWRRAGHAFALIEDRERGVQALLDRAMLACQRPSYHPLTNARTTTIAAADLPRFIEACGHEPPILDLDASGIAVT